MRNSPLKGMLNAASPAKHPHPEHPHSVKKAKKLSKIAAATYITKNIPVGKNVKKFLRKKDE